MFVAVFYSIVGVCVGGKLYYLFCFDIVWSELESEETLDIRVTESGWLFPSSNFLQSWTISSQIVIETGNKQLVRDFGT